VSISDEALEKSIHLSTRYILTKHLPDKAIDLIDEAAARKSTITYKIENDEEYKKIEQEINKISKKIEKAIE
jgi:ATP-dependent Clp protease ATP-binding subunit ClpC